MLSNCRTIRLFVSSTFTDIKAERDILQCEVFPKLGQLCLANGLRFQAIDLRWGVSEEAGRHNRTMRICMRELKRCQQGALKPNFLILLGDRYGWRPLPETVQANLFERLKPLVEANGFQATAALKWYRRDDNAVPSEYFLQPRDGTVVDYNAWCREVEWPLLAAMEWAAAQLLTDARLDDEDRNFLETSIGLSATHQEILRGALMLEDAREHVHVFVRSIRYKLGQIPHKDFVDRLPDGSEDIESKRRLDGLREILENHLGKDNLHSYSVDWRKEGMFTKDDLRQFSEDVYGTLKKIVLAQIAQIETISPEIQEENAHRNFGADQCDGFIDRKDPLRRIASYLASEASSPLVVVGVAGSGKSALMAKAVEECNKTEVRKRDTKQKGKMPEIIERYIGATPGSSDIVGLLQNIIFTIRRKYPVSVRDPADGLSGSGGNNAKSPKALIPTITSDDEIPSDLPSLSAAFRKELGRATTDKPLILFLDALDQLNDTHGAHQLHWLPATLPSNVHLIVSAALPLEIRSPGFSWSGSKSYNAEPPNGVIPKEDPRSSIWRSLEVLDRLEHCVVLDKIEPENGEKLLNRWLGLERRTLQPVQLSTILNKFAHEGNPLWLKMAAVEAKYMASWDKDVPSFPTDIPGLLCQVLKRLSAEENHGPMLISRTLSYLACARHGLAEDELLDILSFDKDVMADVIRRSPTERVKSKAEQIKKLPAAIWVALHGDIAPYLAEREMQNVLLLGFYHRSILEAIQLPFLNAREKLLATHRQLAAFYGELEWFISPADNSRVSSRKALIKDPPDVRKASELPWHLFRLAYLSDPKCNRLEEWERTAQTLSEFLFVEAKCRSGLVLELEEDYLNFLNALPEGQAELAERRHRDQILSRWTEEIIEYASKWSEARSLYLANPNSFQMPKADEIPLPRRPLIEVKEKQETLHSAHGITLRKNLYNQVYAYQKFVQTENHLLVRFGARPGFCVQQAYNSVNPGPVTETAKALATSQLEVPFFFRAGETPLNPYPACIKTIHGNNNCVDALAMTGDGRRAVSGREDNTLSLWDLKTGESLKTLAGHTDRIFSVCISADGRYALSGGFDKWLLVWDLQKGEHIKRFRAPDIVEAVAMTADGRWGISACFGGELWFWDLKEGNIINAMAGRAVAMTPDGRRAVSVLGISQKLFVWDLENGTCINTLDTPAIGNTTPDKNLSPEIRAESGFDYKRFWRWNKIPIALSLDGRLAISPVSSTALNLWDLNSGECLQTLVNREDIDNSAVNSVAIIADNQLAVSAHDNGFLQVWNLATGDCIRKFKAHAGRANSVGVTLDGRKAISGGDDKSIRLWDLQAEVSEEANLLTHSEEVCDTALTSDGRQVVTLGGDGLLSINDIRTGENLKVLFPESLNSHVFVAGLAITADGRRIVSGSDKTLHLWDSRLCYAVYPGGSVKLTGRTYSDRRDWLGTMSGSGHISQISAIATTPDGRWAVSGSMDCTLRYWDLETRECLRTFRGHDKPVNAVVVTPDGQRAVSGSGDGTIRIWDLETGECLKILLESDPVHALALTMDGHSVVLGSLNAKLCIRDLKTGEHVKTFPGHSGAVKTITISSNNRWVISGSFDSTLRVWDYEQGRCVILHASHGGNVNCLASDGRYFCVGTQSGYLEFLHSVNLSFPGPIITTPVRLWLFGQHGPGRWDDNLTFVCLWCRKRFPLSTTIFDTIVNATEECREIRLLSECPGCHGQIKFNPFIVDSADRVKEEPDDKKIDNLTMEEKVQLSSTKQDLAAQAYSAYRKGDINSAMHALDQLELICNNLGDKETLLWCLNLQAAVFQVQEDYSKARALYERISRIRGD